MNSCRFAIPFSFVLITLLNGCTYSRLQCSPDWKVTGFYTPVESDFETDLNRTIQIKSVNADLFSASFNDTFISAVKMEGWGKTRFGWYLGYYAAQWHKENNALNASGKPLVVGAVAVDNRVINQGEQIKIPAVESVMDIVNFKAEDVGSGIKNRHIDIYTGEGNAARKLSYKVTGRHQVCMVKNRLAPVEML